MTFTADIELQRLFEGEVQERAEALALGARAVAAGQASTAVYQDMYREGHTIKGTARMMGYAAISDAGKLLEEAWKAVRDGEQSPTPALAAGLARLAEELVPAVDADPDSGTQGLASGMRLVRAALRDEVVELEPAEVEREPAEPGDLGGLLGTLDSGAFGENVRVKAAGLFRLINEICSLRVDAEAVRLLVDEVDSSVDNETGLRDSLDRLSSLVREAEKSVVDLQGRAVELAETPLSEITSTFPQLARYLARRAGKDVRFEVVGDHHAVDRQVAERLSDPLRHLLVNAIQHGIETPPGREAAGKPQTATVSVRFDVIDHRLTTVVEDDGRGVDWGTVRAVAVERGRLTEPEAANRQSLQAVLFSPRFSTVRPSELVGDGMGLAMVAEAVEALHGTLVLDTEPGSGTRVTITVPTSHALQDAVLIRAAGQTWGIPEIAVLSRIAVDKADLVDAGQRMEMSWDGASIPVMAFADAVGLRAAGDATSVLVVSSPAGPMGLTVEEDLGRRQVAARELGPVLHDVPHLTGAALLGGGDVVVLVDAARLAARNVRAAGIADRPRVLVVDDSRGARQVVGGALGSSGFEVDLAGSPTEALSVLESQDFDAIVLDYVLPTMTGADLATKIRGLGITAPILVLSGLATGEDQRRALEAGADAYLDKDDVREGALAAQIRELLG